MRGLPELRPGHCQVWWATPGDARDAHRKLLSTVEQRRHAAFRRQSDQDRFIVGAALLRLLVAGHTGAEPAAVEIDRSCAGCGEPHGKPRVPGTDLAVSVSHSGEKVAVACGRVAHLGVDVEQESSRVDTEALARRVLHPTEGGDFFTYWTRKEAVLKATGDGLLVPMTEVVVSAPEEPPAVRAFGPRPELVDRFAMATLHPGEGYAAAIAAIADEPPTDGWVAEYEGADLLRDL